MSEEGSFQESKALGSLRLRWWLFAAGCCFMLSGGFFTLWFGWRPDLAVRWLVLPTLATTYLLIVFRRSLPANHRVGEEGILPSLGWSNLLTLMRGLLLAAMTGFLFLPPPQHWLIWLPGILYVLADASDFFDGYVARITGRVTRLGEILDLSFDGLGVLVASLLAVQYGQAPAWYLAVAFARPLFLAGLWLRRRSGLPVYELPTNMTRRIFAGLQMGFLAVILLPLFSPPGTHIAAALFALPLLAGFLRDWLFVSGALQPGRLPEALQNIFSRWTPLALRLAVLALNLMIMASWSDRSAADILVLNLVNATLVGLVVLGIMPRTTSIFALSMLGFYQMVSPLSAAQMILAVVYTTIIYFGGGRLSLWTPEEKLFQRHAGELPFRTMDAMDRLEQSA